MSTLVQPARVVWLGLFALALAACGGAATPAPQDAGMTQPLALTVNMKEFAFEPAEISVKVGQPVKLTLVNQGALLHDFTSMDAEVDVMSMEEGAEHEMGDEMHDAKMHMAVDINHSEVLEFTPTKAGAYTFFCTVEGHEEAGMIGKLIVTP